MTDVEQIALWLETQHCKEENCVKPTCLLFRDLAEEVRQGKWRRV